MKLILLLLFAFSMSHAIALVDETSVSVATWRKIDEKPALHIQLGNQISKKQRKLINSGFSTFSALEFYANSSDIDESDKAFFRLSCTVKFDTWEEYYDLARLDGQLATSIVRDFDSYADRCLAGAFADTEIIDELKTKGGELYARLRINQISVERAGEIKEWLIRQQSGLMQGLFSHMLGELKLAEEIVVHVKVVPMIAVSQNEPKSPSDL